MSIRLIQFCAFESCLFRLAQKESNFLPPGWPSHSFTIAEWISQPIVNTVPSGTSYVFM